MNGIINQFRRIYSDDGRGDVDFTDQETKLRESTARMITATEFMIRASQRLNRAAMMVVPTKLDLH